MKATMPKVQGDDDDLLEDSDEEDLPSNFGDSDAVDASENGNDDDEEQGDDGDGLSLAEASDNEDLNSLDGDLPHGLIEYDGSDADAGDDDTDGDDDDDAATPAKDEEWGISSGKRKREDDKTGKRKKLRSLPTFASYEDYAKLIEDGLEDDI
jgi:ribosome biogenesis protein MAK21